VCLDDTEGGTTTPWTAASGGWWEQPWWVFLAAWIIAFARSTWMRERIRADGGLSRPRNSVEQLLLWTALSATVLMDLTIAACTTWNLTH